VSRLGAQWPDWAPTCYAGRMATKKKAKKATSKKKPAATKKKRRTMNVPESQRHTERVILRLDPDVAARLRSIAEAWHVTLAEVVTDALDALKKVPRKPAK
jgi:uncharacterized protein (DUF4415 family)